MEPPSNARAHSAVSHPTFLYNVVQSLHGFLNRSLLVEPAQLKHVYTIDLQPLQARLYGLKNMLSVVPRHVYQSICSWVVTRFLKIAWRENESVQLGEDDGAFARNVQVLEGSAKRTFRFSIGIDVSGIECLRTIVSRLWMQAIER